VQGVNETSAPPFSSNCPNGLEFGEYKECTVLKGTGILTVNVGFSDGKLIFTRQHKRFYHLYTKLIQSSKVF
jgi:hypothetical protein